MSCHSVLELTNAACREGCLVVLEAYDSLIPNNRSSHCSSDSNARKQSKPFQTNWEILNKAEHVTYISLRYVSEHMVGGVDVDLRLPCMAGATGDLNSMLSWAREEPIECGAEVVAEEAGVVCMPTSRRTNAGRRRNRDRRSRRPWSLGWIQFWAWRSPTPGRLTTGRAALGGRDTEGESTYGRWEAVDGSGGGR